MEMPFGGSGHNNGQIVPYGENLTLERQGFAATYATNEESGPSINNIGNLIRRYWLLVFFLMILGAAAGFTSVVLSSPMYKARLLLEVQGGSEIMFRDAVMVAASDANNEVNIQTQISILHSGSFLKRGADRMQSESVPLAPTGRDIFSRLRQRLHPATQDPLENARRGLMVAVQTFDARPVTRTRLIELTCESTSPDVAAQFLNAMAAEFAEDTSRTRMQSSQKTSEWLAAQIEETKSKVQESEEHLRDFVQASGNLFVQDSTLADTKLAQLKGELAKIQAERIAKQTRYELTLKNPPETLGEILDDGVLRGYQQQISTLERDKAALETTYTSKNEKVRKIDAQLAFLKTTYVNEVTSVVNRIKNDYDAALRHETLLATAFNGQSQRVGSEAGKAAQYNALKREVETLRQMYQSLLMQSNQAGLSSSVPINPIRVVEPSSPPETPYKPQPVFNISFGTIFGVALATGLVFLRERMDHSIQSPDMSRRLLNTPALGVIPNLRINGNGGISRAFRNGKDMSIEGAVEGATAALLSWQEGPAFVAESFRGTLASILRNQAGRKQKTILITSAGPAEGKTTVIQNLGIALAETGAKVLLVDADFRRPHLHHKFSLSNEFSLIDLISETRALDQYPPERFGLPSGFAGLSVLPNRPTQDNVSKALYSPRLRAIFEILMERYDMILVDAPPILHVADTRIMAPLTDALILVLRCGVTSREAAVEAHRRIQEDGLSLLGTVLTDYDLSANHKRQYYDDYGQPNRA